MLLSCMGATYQGLKFGLKMTVKSCATGTQEFGGVEHHPDTTRKSSTL